MHREAAEFRSEDTKTHAKKRRVFRKGFGRTITRRRGKNPGNDEQVREASCLGEKN